MQFWFPAHARHSSGFTLVELMTVIAVMCLLSFWLIKSTKETYYDYQIRVAIEQAQQDLQLLEMIRRGGDVVGVWDAGLGALRADIPDYLQRFTRGMSPIGIDDDVKLGTMSYSIQDQRSMVTLTFPEAMVENIYIPAAKDFSGDTAGTRSFEFYSRERDPLIHSYTADAHHMKRQLGR